MGGFGHHDHAFAIDETDCDEMTLDDAPDRRPVRLELLPRPADLPLASLDVAAGRLVLAAAQFDDRAPGGFEISMSGVEIVQRAEPFPITPKEHGVEFLMEHRHLWLRSQRQWAILRIRATVIKAIRDWLDDNGFLLVDTPLLTPAAAEGTTTLFETEYFGDKAYLTQSGQLYNEATIGAFGKTYCFGPAFRAEKSKTRRHVMELWMVEPEAAYVELGQMGPAGAVAICREVGRAVRGELGQALQPALGWDSTKFTAQAAARRTEPGRLRAVDRAVRERVLHRIGDQLVDQQPARQKSAKEDSSLQSSTQEGI